MRFHFLLYIALFTFSFSPSVAVAQQEELSSEQMEKLIGESLSANVVKYWQRYLRGNKRSYQEALALLKSGRANDTFENTVAKLRYSYAHINTYSPFSKGLVDKMVEHAYNIDTSDDPALVNEAMVEYNKILDDHLANLGVLNYALNLSRLDARYGNQMFLKRVRKAIIFNLFHGNVDGLTPEKAYKVKTYAEETYVLQRLKARVNKTEFYAVGKTFYNVHDVTLPDGSFIQIFINITEPITGAYVLGKLRERQVNIPSPSYAGPGAIETRP